MFSLYILFCLPVFSQILPGFMIPFIHLYPFYHKKFYFTTDNPDTPLSRTLVTHFLDFIKILL